ncbi:hypothetical protein AVEN_93242-1 [Araneus ventricosus]|uniref:Tc1-like transposase DDE domain-containing protein n=1 Tax=Araneus ventricosus TaxID=182803 RepID=A0A4Y2X0P8_ARAVE|nr:hypothetical protein AVEN_93242-1 [Araneus ventricosus]
MAQRCRYNLPRPFVVPYIAAVGDKLILIDDNCRPHPVWLVEDFLKHEESIRMFWPTYFWNINPIEHVWDMLGSFWLPILSINGSRSEREALLVEWDRIHKFLEIRPRFV